MQLILLSGLSGSGKSVALKALEDAGYFAVDNLPATLIKPLIESLGAHIAKVAVSIDVRAGATLGVLPQVMQDLSAQGLDCRLIFLDANDDVLQQRFAETRRPHPLSERIAGGVMACIAEERRILADIAALAHRMETSDANANALRSWIKDWLKIDQSRLALTFVSFGFKHGIPMDADLVFDARFLPNPFYDPALKALTGCDAPVAAFLAADTEVNAFFDDVVSLLARWLPAYTRDHRVALTVAIGCTGGQHRSVYLVERLADRFAASQQVLIRHRDLPR